MKIIQYNA